MPLFVAPPPSCLLLSVFLMVAILAQQFQVAPCKCNVRIVHVPRRQTHLVVHFRASRYLSRGPAPLAQPAHALDVRRPAILPRRRTIERLKIRSYPLCFFNGYHPRYSKDAVFTVGLSDCVRFFRFPALCPPADKRFICHLSDLWSFKIKFFALVVIVK